MFDLDLMQGEIAKIAIALVIDGPDTVSGLARIRLSIEDIASFEVDPTGGAEKALILGEVYRHGTGWKFRALGQGFNGGLEPLALNYGVDVAAPPPPVATPPAAPVVSLEKRIEQRRLA